MLIALLNLLKCLKYQKLPGVPPLGPAGGLQRPRIHSWMNRGALPPNPRHIRLISCTPPPNEKVLDPPLYPTLVALPTPPCVPVCCLVSPCLHRLLGSKYPHAMGRPCVPPCAVSKKFCRVYFSRRVRRVL